MLVHTYSSGQGGLTDAFLFLFAWVWDVGHWWDDDDCVFKHYGIPFGLERIFVVY